MDYEVGDIIEYRDFCGGLRKVQVSLRDSDIKNGRPGFDGEVVSGPNAGLSVWGYDSQITRVRIRS